MSDRIGTSQQTVEEALARAASKPDGVRPLLGPSN